METQPAGPSPGKRTFSADPWLFALLACGLLLLLLSSRLINDFDMGYHLKGGEWILQHRQVPRVDDFTYTVAGHPYLDIQWLYQLGLYLVYRMGGYPLISLLNILLIAGAFLLVLRRMRLPGASLAAVAALFAVLILSCEKRFQVRPEIASWALLSATLWVLELRTRKGRDRLWLLPLIQLLWVNIEGLFPLGWACMGAYALDGLRTRRWDRKLTAYSAASLAACLVNPNFLDGVLFPFNYLSTLGTQNAFKQHIAELQPSWDLSPNHYLLFSAWLPLFTYRAFSVALLALMAATWKKRALQEWLLVAAFFYLSATAQRNIPLFMIAALPVAAACIKDLPWGRVPSGVRTLLARPWAAWGFTLAILLFCARVATGAYYASDRRLDRLGFGLDGDNFPVKAVQFLKDQGLGGPILNQQDAGGWLAWQGPQKEFIDARLEVMGPTFFQEYLSSFTPGGLVRLADRYQADILLFNPHTASDWVFELKQAGDWRPVYLDGYYAVYLRPGYAPQVPALDDGQVLSRAGVDAAVTTRARAVLGSPRPSPFTTWVEGFFAPQPFPHDLLDQGLYYFDSGRPRTAEPVFLTAIQRTGGRYFEFYLDSAILYSLEGRQGEAALAARQVLSEIPGNPIALRILSGKGLR